MKKLMAILLAAMMVLSLAACGNEANSAGSAEPPQNGTEAEATADTNDETDAPSEPTDSAPSEPSEAPEGGKKILIAYFSATNNTEGIARKLAEGLGAGLGIWGVINLLEGYGNDNPGANAHIR